MPAYLVTITMPDGSQAEHTGIYPDSIDAVTTAQECFPEATRVTAKALVLRCARTRYLGAAPVYAKRSEGERA